MNTKERETTSAADARQDLAQYLGGWGSELSAECEEAPEFFDRFERMLRVPRGRGALGLVDQALIGIAVVGNTASTNWSRLEAYIRVALHVGATRAQVRDVLRLVSIMSIHALTVGIPALAGVLAERGIDVPDALDERRLALKEEFIRVRGYWHESWDDMLALDPEMFDAYTGFSIVVAEFGSLDVRLRELIYIAIDCVVTHLYVPGIEIHVRNALDSGATTAQILTAMEIAALTGADPYFEAIERSPSLRAAATRRSQ